MKIGYVRVSTEEQNTARQEVLLRSQEVDELFINKASGKSTERPELHRMMDYAMYAKEIPLSLSPSAALRITQKTCWSWSNA